MSNHVPLTADYQEIGTSIVECALKVHRALGPGLLEKVYEACLCYELQKAGLEVARQVCIPIIYDGVYLGENLRMDILVEGKVIVEAKSVEQVNSIWHAQILSQLKITGHRLGYLINFNVPLIKEGIKRIIL
jgi:GxxExxY protein